MAGLRMLGERFHRPKLTKDVARLLALLALDRDADTYAARGPGRIEPKLQQIEVKALKSDKRKVKMLRRAPSATPPTSSSRSTALGPPSRSWGSCCRP